MKNVIEDSFSQRRAFTLIEMLIAISIFAIIAIAFIGILVVVTQVQVQSSSSAVVTQESQFLQQKLQYYIQTASLVDISTSTPTSTLKLEMASDSADPTVISLTGNTVYLQQHGGTPQPLTSNKVTVSNLSFTRQSNPPGLDAVNIAYTMQYNVSNVKQQFSQFFQTSIAQVSAATFDTGLYASTNPEPLGNSTNEWSPINGAVWFSGTNVAIGPSLTTPSQQLEVDGGLRLNPTNVSEPTCNSSTPNIRGTLWFVNGGASADHVDVCAQSGGAGTLGWQHIF